MRGRRCAFLIAGLVAIATIACSPAQRVRTETVLARVLITDEQSNQIGMQVHGELAGEGVRYVGDSAVNDYVQGFAGVIFTLARADRSGVDYYVYVIDDPKTVNAFATPGGQLYLYSGLLLAAENEAEVVGVLAHEVGHVVGRHIERAMVNAYGLQGLASLALGDNPSLAAEVVSGFVTTGVMRAHGRSEETEADEYGARYTARAGYDPRALATFFQKLQALEGGGSGGFAWLRDHPPTADRIAHVERFIRERGLRGATLGVERHQEIRRRLR